MNDLIALKGLDFNRSDFTLVFHEWDFHSIEDRHGFLLQLKEAKRAALKHGYTIEETRRPDTMTQSIRFFRAAPERKKQQGEK